MTGINEGWVYLSKAEATWAYSICGFVFALFMIAGGRIQDRYGPKVGATGGGQLSLGNASISARRRGFDFSISSLRRRSTIGPHKPPP